MPQSLTVQSWDSDELVDKQKLISIVCKLDKNLKLGLQTKYYVERHWKLISPLFVREVFIQTRMLTRLNSEKLLSKAFLLNINSFREIGQKT